jgi:hypothetical protein
MCERRPAAPFHRRAAGRSTRRASWLAAGLGHGHPVTLTTLISERVGARACGVPPHHPSSSSVAVIGRRDVDVDVAGAAVGAGGRVVANGIAHARRPVTAVDARGIDDLGATVGPSYAILHGRVVPEAVRDRELVVLFARRNRRCRTCDVLRRLGGHRHSRRTSHDRRSRDAGHSVLSGKDPTLSRESRRGHESLPLT